MTVKDQNKSEPASREVPSHKDFVKNYGKEPRRGKSILSVDEAMERGMVLDRPDIMCAIREKSI
jgi:hypothetical protein